MGDFNHYSVDKSLIRSNNMPTEKLLSLFPLALLIMRADYLLWSTHQKFRGCQGLTVLLVLLSGSSHHHGGALRDVVQCCEAACLQLNMNKTKEMIMTFSNSLRQLAEIK